MYIYVPWHQQVYFYKFYTYGMVKFQQECMKAMYIHYSKGTLDINLQYKLTSDTLQGYSDADWANDLQSMLSTTGNAFIMSGRAVS